MSINVRQFQKVLPALPDFINITRDPGLELHGVPAVRTSESRRGLDCLGVFFFLACSTFLLYLRDKPLLTALYCSNLHTHKSWRKNHFLKNAFFPTKYNVRKPELFFKVLRDVN